MSNDKKELTIKLLFVAIGVALVFAIAVGQYVWNLTFAPESFDFNKWLTKTIFNGSISLIMMVLGFVALGSTLKAKEGGKYQKRIETFGEIVEQLYETNRIVYFDQYLDWQAERQLREKKIRHLTKQGIARSDAMAIVDYAKQSDIETICGVRRGDKPTEKLGKDVVRVLPSGKEVLIPACKGTLAPFIDDVLSGAISIDLEDASYYVSATKNKQSMLTSLERAQATERDRVKALRSSFISRIITAFVYITIFAMLGVDKNAEAGTQEAVYSLVSRLTDATAGFILGGFVGITNTSYVVKWIGDKMRVLREFNKFIDTKEFVPVSYAETAQARIDAIHKEEEDAKASVIEPEIINNDSELMLLK